MKKIIPIFWVFVVSSLAAQTENGSYSLFNTESDPYNKVGKDYAHVLGNTTFTTTLNGAIDTVWQHTEERPEQNSIITNQFLAASDGSFYFASYRFGGFLTKINSNGEIEWTIDRCFSGDTSKYYTEFKNISELPNGDILVYGSEGKKGFQLYQLYPIRFIISPDGIIKEEKSMRGLLALAIPNHRVNAIFPDTRIYMNIYRRDSLSFFEVDTSFTKIQSNILFKNEYAQDPFFSGGGRAIPYDDTSFIFINYGTFLGDTAASAVLLRFSREYKQLNRTVIRPLGVVMSAYNDGALLILRNDEKRKINIAKYDIQGSVLWDKQPEMLKSFFFDNFNIKRGNNGGFIVCGEIYPPVGDGSIHYSIEERHGIVFKLNDEGECEWYYTIGKKDLRNTIQSFAEASNGDVVFVCNSLSLTGDPVSTPMQITRLRHTITGVIEQPVTPKDNISIYPNPTSTTVTISGIEGSTSVRIMNSLGMEVTTGQVANGTAKIDVANFANGVYFASIRTLTGAVVKPIVVNR
ncbi:MAG: T9SS type A sorting domain-containing protein [Ignavibacteriae bacterium]|nr:T9SS type A sorting domain-containing protein [Ignavibacteriota bacterium]